MILGYSGKRNMANFGLCMHFNTLFYVLFTISLIKNMLCLQIDYISRLMWQAQLRGHKTWRLVPPPDCDHICTGLSFRVEPGDIGK